MSVLSVTQMGMLLAQICHTGDIISTGWCLTLLLADDEGARCGGSSPLPIQSAVPRFC